MELLMCDFRTTGKFMNGDKALKGLNIGLLNELHNALESHFLYKAKIFNVTGIIQMLIFYFI